MKYIDAMWLSKDLSEELYLNNIAFIKELKLGKKVKFDKSVSFFVGENGTGKSSLLEAIAVQSGFNAEGGSKNFNFSTVTAMDTELAECITISKIAHPKDGFF